MSNGTQTTTTVHCDGQLEGGVREGAPVDGWRTWESTGQIHFECKMRPAWL